MKANKQTATDKLKYGSTRISPLAVPQIIQDDIKSHGWVYRWGSKAKFDKQGGTDLRGYIAYRVPTKLRKPLEPGQYAEDYASTEDGLFHRGDLILLVMPAARRVANMKAIAERNKVDKNTIRQQVEHNGLSLEEASFEQVIVKNTNNPGD